MAVIFQSGFETGDFSDFHTVATDASIVTAPVKDGVYAASVAAGSSGFRMGGAWDVREVYAEFWLRIDRSIAASQYVSSVANMEDMSGLDLAYLRARHYTDGRIGLYFRNVAGALAQDVAGEHFIDPGVWYRFGYRLRVGAGTGLLELQIDGTSVMLHENRDLAEANIGQLMLYNSSTGSPRTSYFDSITVDDAGWSGGADLTGTGAASASVLSAASGVKSAASTTSVSAVSSHSATGGKGSTGTGAASLSVAATANGNNATTVDFTGTATATAATIEAQAGSKATSGAGQATTSARQSSTGTASVLIAGFGSTAVAAAQSSTGAKGSRGAALVTLIAANDAGGTSPKAGMATTTADVGLAATGSKQATGTSAETVRVIVTTGLRYRRSVAFYGPLVSQIQYSGGLVGSAEFTGGLVSRVSYKG